MKKDVFQGRPGSAGSDGASPYQTSSLHSSGIREDCLARQILALLRKGREIITQWARVLSGAAGHFADPYDRGGLATIAVALLWMKLFPTLRNVERME
jgi:hypothetical protein